MVVDRYRIGAIAGVVMILFSGVAPAVGPVAASSTTSSNRVSISQTPESTSVVPGTNVTFEIRLETPDGYNGPAVDVDLPEGWEIVNQSSSGTYRPSHHQWIWLSSGNKTVEYTVHVPENTTGNSSSFPIIANGSAVNPATETIESTETASPLTMQLPIVCAGCGVPTDPDNDGDFEDTNGNDRTDFDDVVTLFEHMEDPAIEDHAQSYNFNRNDRIDFDDIVTLFEEI